MNDDLKLLEATAHEIFASYQDRPGLWEELEEAGLTRVGIPEELGGSGGDLEQAAVILRAAGYHAAEIPLAETLWLAGPLLASVGLHVPAGPLTAALPLDGRTTLAAEGDGWILDGVVRRVPWARGAAAVAVVAGGRIALIDPSADGVRLTEHRNLAGEPRDDLAFDRVTVSADRVRELPAGQPSALSRAALGRSVQMSGAARRAVEHSLRYAGERKQFGRAIGKFQAVQQYLATMASETAILDLGTRSAVTLTHTGSADAALAIAADRVNVCRAAGVVTDLAHQVHGAIGTTHEHDLRRSTLRLWSWRDEYGDENHWSDVLALLVAGRDPWHLITDGAPVETTARKGKRS
ncbi:acyl-CoA dehydrogenase family protein [Streptomyces abyssomicinicus]|uniref:acyl-CoA dehydrogenase family protein n=1 Tax=Streptomyces abyssomicinicus TaxID=574929 RepID=UPI00125053E5|nr:acyl-CoA dehydrogenase family protein [Streptomyces abyssomicinicus]